MQYDVTLPADYDMRVISNRVATRGHLLDSLSGLILKAYCVRERASAGSRVNQYAPFYVWSDTGAMTGFLGSDGFRGLCESFGRPVVQHWAGVASSEGAGRGLRPTWVTRHLTAVGAEIDIGEAVATATQELADIASDSNVYTTVLALDPRRWELARFTLWNRQPADVQGTLYRALHLSMPRPDAGSGA